jgi:hypothetical protein
MPTGQPSATARLLHLALISGVVLMTAIFLLLPRPSAPVPNPILLYATFGIGAVMFAGALVIANQLPRDSATRDADEWWRANLGRAVVVWAMLEGPALLGAVVHFLTGSLLPLLVTGSGIAFFLLTAPERLREGR